MALGHHAVDPLNGDRVITSKQLAVAIDKHKAAVNLAVQQFIDGADLEVLTRELLMHVDNLQQLLVDFREQEETVVRKCNRCSCKKYDGSKLESRIKPTWTRCSCGHVAQDHS